MVKRYEELTISDDFMFGKAMGDKVLCRDVLDRLDMGVPVYIRWQAGPAGYVYAG